MKYQSPLRDLILKIDAAAAGHIAYSQASDALRHLREHLSALARCEEVNRDLEIAAIQNRLTALDIAESVVKRP